jgi:hypothetical protein
MAMGFYGIDIIPDMHNLFWGCAIIVSGIGAASIVLSASLWFFMEEYKSAYIKKEKEVLKEVSTRNIEITETDNVEKNSTEDSEKLKVNKD